MAVKLSSQGVEDGSERIDGAGFKPTGCTIGHVAHGKSTVVKAISGVQTARFKMNLSETSLLSLDMQMQKYTNVKMKVALEPCATSHTEVARRIALFVMCLDLKSAG